MSIQYILLMIDSFLHMLNEVEHILFIRYVVWGRDVMHSGDGRHPAPAGAIITKLFVLG